MSATNKSIKSGHDLLNRTITALPFELHIPGYQFCRDPGTHLEKRLARGDQGINPLDAACREHDIAYSRSNDLTERHADRILGVEARKRITAKDSTLGEKIAATAIWAAMKAKTKIGMGMKTKTKMKTKKKRMKKRVLPTAKRGDILPILPILGILGSLIGGVWRRL